MEYLNPTDSTVLYAEGYQPFDTRAISSHIRKRGTGMSDGDSKAFLNARVPNAE